jgi:SAM-dependent methyltransferase
MEAVHGEIAEKTDEVELESVERCDLCGGRAFTLRRRWTDQLLFGSRKWNLVECDACSLHFIDPRPTRSAIGAFYPNDYPAHAGKPAAPKRWHRRVSAPDAPPLRFWERPWIQIRQSVSWYRFPRWHGEGHVLDVGCGNGGRYLDVLKALGWTTYGVEPSAPAVASAVAKGHQAVVGGAEELHVPERSMDVVTIWHVLEHTHSPRQALESCFRALKPGGLLSLCVPNYGSLQAKLLGRFWWSCDAPRHLFQLTRPTLRRYLDEVGFRGIRMTTRSGSTSWQRAVRHMLNAAFGTRWTRDSGWLSDAVDPFIALESIVRFFGVGAELRVIAECPAAS